MWELRTGIQWCTRLNGGAHDAAFEALLLRVRHFELVGAARHADDEVRVRQLPHAEQQLAHLLDHCALLLLRAVRREPDAHVLGRVLRRVREAELAERVRRHLDGPLVARSPRGAGGQLRLRVAPFARLDRVAAHAEASAKFDTSSWIHFTVLFKVVFN